MSTDLCLNLGYENALELVIFSDASLGNLPGSGTQGGHSIMILGGNGNCSAGQVFLANDVCYSSSIKHLSHTQTDSIISELFNKHLQTVNDNIIYKVRTIVLLSFSPSNGSNPTAVFADFSAAWL